MAFLRVGQTDAMCVIAAPSDWFVREEGGAVDTDREEQVRAITALEDIGAVSKATARLARALLTDGVWQVDYLRGRVALVSHEAAVAAYHEGVRLPDGFPSSQLSTEPYGWIDGYVTREGAVQAARAWVESRPWDKWPECAELWLEHADEFGLNEATRERLRTCRARATAEALKKVEEALSDTVRLTTLATALEGLSSSLRAQAEAQRSLVLSVRGALAELSEGNEKGYKAEALSLADEMRKARPGMDTLAALEVVYAIEAQWQDLNIQLKQTVIPEALLAYRRASGEWAPGLDDLMKDTLSMSVWSALLGEGAPCASCS